MNTLQLDAELNALIVQGKTRDAFSERAPNARRRECRTAPDAEERELPDCA
jgi:hypothetical protein